jgi:type II secretory pathway pseudopilin PulG
MGIRSNRKPKCALKVPRSERGYALVALMGVMMFAMILMTAAAPSIKFHMQREREEEMLWRGHQIAVAIAAYNKARPGTYPTDLKELVEGVSVGVKKIRLLRPSALCDPMMPCEPGSTNWRLVHPGDPLIKELLDAYIATQQKGAVILRPPPPNLIQLARLSATTLPGQEADTKLDGVSGPSNSPGLGFSNSLSDKKPIVGVVSRKTAQMFRAYLGIEENDHALFFSGVQVIAGGLHFPMPNTQGPGSNPGGANNPGANTPGGLGQGFPGNPGGGITPGTPITGPGASPPGGVGGGPPGPVANPTPPTQPTPTPAPEPTPTPKPCTETQESCEARGGRFFPDSCICTAPRPGQICRGENGQSIPCPKKQ